jgi:hypothetical protein
MIREKGTEKSVSSCNASGFTSWGGSASNLGRDTDYPDSGFPWLFSVPPDKYQGTTSVHNLPSSLYTNQPAIRHSMAVVLNLCQTAAR